MKFAVLLTRDMSCGEGVRLEIAVPAGEAGHLLTYRCFERLEDTVQKARSYRGKILSLEYSRLGSGITVHKLPVIRREDIILPQSTLMLIEKNIIRFAEQRAKLSELRMSVKRGILFYGLPGTGKTYTIQYLAGEMKDHTILLITAEQVVSLSIYISLARMLQPSIVVIEDVDLIARDRTEMDTP